MTNPAGPHVLYVEDEPMVLEVGAIVLERSGLRVTALKSGEEAIRVVSGPDNEFRALIADVALGGGPSGWDVARKARQRFDHLPIIYVTGGSAHEWPSKGVPGSVLIRKPYALAQLTEAVLDALQGPAAVRP
jgi:CheY-like chemotaxis protein